MGNGGNRGNGIQEPISIEALLREAAYAAWAATREEHQDSSRDFFDCAYLGHFASVEQYAETLVDNYELDARLDAAIAPPFREFVDIDVTGLAQSLVRSGTLYAIRATPVGVWIFNVEMG